MEFLYTASVFKRQGYMSNSQQGTELPNIKNSNVDPTIAPGIPGTYPNQLLIRTDVPSLYRYVGPLDTNWEKLGSGAAIPSLPDLTDTPGVLVTSAVPFKVGSIVAVPGEVDRLSIDVDNGGSPGTVSIHDFGIAGKRSTFNTNSNLAPIMFGQLFGANSIPGISGGGIVNNVSIQRSSLFANPPGGGTTLTGIESSTATNLLLVQNAFLFIHNRGPGDLTLEHEGATSTDVNRFNLVGAANLVIPVNGGVVIVRASTINRWFVVGKNV